MIASQTYVLQQIFIHHLQTPGILSSSEFRAFRIKAGIVVNRFTISVGRGSDTTPFMSYSWDQQEHHIKYIGFSSWSGLSAEWRLGVDLQLATQDYSYTYFLASEFSGVVGKLIFLCLIW